MHRNPAVAANSLKFFGIVAVSAFVYEWFPSLIFPLLGTIPFVCYFGHGNWIAYILGSGNYGFGLLNFSLDWNYATFFSPLYTPLWAAAHQYGFAFFLCWGLYPIMYFTNTLNAKSFAPMSSSTFDADGNAYNTSKILNADLSLNQTALDAYSPPYWSAPYAMYFFWGFAASTGAMLYSILYYGYDSYIAVKEAIANRKTHQDDPYLQLMSFDPRVPHWWYLALLVVCAALSLATLYQGGFQLPWWGFILICLISWVFTFPNGILWGVANMQVGMAFLSEVIAGSLFPGKPLAVLSCMVYGRQILEQNLNLISDYKFGFYMKIPEREMFWGQVYGTLLGPFVNYGLMRVIINSIGKDVLTGAKHSTAWNALKTKNFYSTSILWGILGPKNFFANGSMYSFVYYGFFLGPIAVAVVWAVHKWKPHWQLEERFNPVLLFYGGTLFPVYQTTNLLTSALFSMFFMGYVYRYHPVWFRKYNYLLGVGLDCGTQLMTTVMTFGINLPNASMPFWWGNSATGYTDRCFPPSTLPPAAQP